MIRQGYVDGVRALLGPASGPVRAGLVFRVGMADEPLARRGITHLVEHLALHPLGQAGYDFNGATGLDHTHFYAEGSPEEVAGFVTGVCAALADLPLHRLATEKDVLRAEAAGRPAGVAEPLALWRHGARDYGAAGYDELGLDAITADDVRAWAARYFTRDNVVLWVAGDRVPDGIRLGLPGGAPRPAPAPSSALPVTPASFAGPPGGVAWQAIVPREARFAVLADLLQREMFRSLREQAGLSYTVQTDFQPYGPEGAAIVAVADEPAGKPGAVLGGLVDVLAALRVGRIDPAEVTTVIDKRCAALPHAQRLPGQAMNVLAGLPVQQVEEAIAELRAVTPAAVVEAVAEADRTALLMTPGGAAADWAGFAAAPVTSAETVTGTAYPSIGESAVRLVAGADGVSLIAAGDVATVRFDACAAVRAWPDGARHLIGHDAIALVVEPSLFVNGAAVTSLVDAGTPAHLRIAMPPRDPEQIPLPRQERPVRPSALTFPRPSPAWTILMTILFVSGLVRVVMLFTE